MRTGTLRSYVEFVIVRRRDRRNYFNDLSFIAFCTFPYVLSVDASRSEYFNLVITGDGVGFDCAISYSPPIYTIARVRERRKPALPTTRRRSLRWKNQC